MGSLILQVRWITDIDGGIDLSRDRKSDMWKVRVFCRAYYWSRLWLHGTYLEKCIMRGRSSDLRDPSQLFLTESPLGSESEAFSLDS